MHSLLRGVASAEPIPRVVTRQNVCSGMVRQPLSVAQTARDVLVVAMQIHQQNPCLFVIV
jgi:hypothetical protein